MSTASSAIPTPIPLGGEHLNTLPTFSRWGNKKGRISAADQRDYARRAIACDIWLIDSQSRVVLRCKTDDLCDAGLRAHAPLGFGLGIGQRYEVRIAVPEISSPHDRAPSLGHGTIIRKDILLAPDRQDRVTFVLKFDVPQLLPV